MSRRKAGDKKVTVGNVTDVSGEVYIAGGDIGYTARQVSVLLTQITSTLQPKPFDGRCPYKGLEVFEEDDADLFFGREKLVDDLVNRVKESRTVFITGPSGSGKSSLVRAGLIPVLKQGAIKNLHSERWLYETMKPGREPIKELAQAFSRLKSPDLAGYFRAHANEMDILHECAESVLSGRKDQRFLLFIDQFEEIFSTTINDAERTAVLNMLAHAATVENGRIIVLFAMRSDFVSNCASYPGINELLSQQFRQIGAMQPDELVSAIAQPALQVGLRISPDLITQIINDMQGEPGTLPLMQFALKDLFDSQQEKSGVLALTLDDYLRLGGVHKSLERYADNSFAKLGKDEQELARSIFSGLIEIGRGTQDIRRIAFFDELIPAKNKAEDVGAVVQKLADARLITTDEQAGKDTVAISHEKLIDAWPWLKKLVDENRDVIALQNIILNDSKEWDENKRDKSYLYHGARLAKVRQQLIAKDVHLSGSANEFVGASILRQRWGAWSIAALIMTVTIPAIIVISVFIYDFLVSAKLNQSIADFVSPTSSTQRLHVLAQLYRQKGILSSTNSSLQATELFYGLSTYDQLSMFTDYAISGDPGRQNDLVVVVSHLYITVADVNSTEDNTALLKVMRDSLRTNVHDRTGVELGEEISMWIEGRQQVRNGNYQDALSNYSTAIALNSGNPATLYERAKVYVALKRPTDALKDLDTAIAVAKRSAPNIPLTPTPTGISLSASEIPNSALTDVNEADTRTPPPTLELGLAPTLPSPLLTPQRIETFQSNFTTFIDIINAVRILIESTPELQMAIRSNGQSEYTNLQSAGMIRNYPTITPSSTP